MPRYASPAYRLGDVKGLVEDIKGRYNESLQQRQAWFGDDMRRQKKYHSQLSTNREVQYPSRTSRQQAYKKRAYQNGARKQSCTQPPHF